MSVAEVAFGSAWPPQPPLPRWAVALLALGGAGAALVALALVFAGPGTYAEIAGAEGFERNVFHLPGNGSPPQEVRYDRGTLVELHARTLSYVLERSEELPQAPGTGRPLFSPDERGHLADVRAVFGGARAAGLGGLLVFLGVAAVGAQRGAGVLLRGLRDAAVMSGVAVALIGLIAALAFGPAFLVFHYVFFPQGNFLFDPATSNLLALYPEPYWYGTTLRIAGSFLAGAALLAIVTHLALVPRRR